MGRVELRVCHDVLTVYDNPPHSSQRRRSLEALRLRSTMRNINLYSEDFGGTQCSAIA